MVARYSIYITSFYRQERTRELGIVLDNILEWKHCLADATIISNVDAYETTGFLDRYRKQFAARGFSLDLDVAGNLENPRLLTWCHKRFLPKWIEGASPGEDFFVYIEDDIALSNSNIEYFRRTLPATKTKNLIPGFILYENYEGERRLVNVTRQEYWERERSLLIDGKLFHSNLNPYWAGFILDLELAREYLKSRSFDLQRSQSVHHWNIQERAAMGLTYESPFRFMKSRVVVPMTDGLPDDAVYVWHCANNYSESNHPIQGKLTPEDAYVTESMLHYMKRKIRNLPGGVRRRLPWRQRS